MKKLARVWNRAKNSPFTIQTQRFPKGMEAECCDGWQVLHLIGERKKRQQQKVTAQWRRTADLRAITYRDKETVWRAEVLQEGTRSRMATGETSVTEVRFSGCFHSFALKIWLDSSRCPPYSPLKTPASILTTSDLGKKPGLLDVNALTEGFRKVL